MTSSLFLLARSAAFVGVMLGLASSVSFAQTQVLIDFGSAANQTTVDSESRQWNNVVHTMTTGTTFGLVDSANAATGVTFTLTQAFNVNDVNTNGLTNLNPDYPATATGDSLFGNVADFGGESNVVPVLTLSGFNPNQSVDLSFFASRGLTSDNRIMRYEITGASTTNLFLEANGNTGSHTVSASGILASVSGTITISVNHSTVAESGLPTIGSGDQATGFAYLGALDIQYTAIPEPSASAALGASVVLIGAVALRRRRAN
ncbi:MAG: PEP-CTERM sorting domain-containing protein [Verrucomicrobiota bacterium]